MNQVDHVDDWKDAEDVSVRADRWWWHDDLSNYDPMIVRYGQCLGMGLDCNIWKRAMKRGEIFHTLAGTGRDNLGYNALRYELLRVQGNNNQLENYPILANLPAKVALFLYEFHSKKFNSMGLYPLPSDRSNFDVEGHLTLIQVPLKRERYI